MNRLTEVEDIRTSVLGVCHGSNHMNEMCTKTTPIAIGIACRDLGTDAALRGISRGVNLQVEHSY